VALDTETRREIARVAKTFNARIDELDRRFQAFQKEVRDVLESYRDPASIRQTIAEYGLVTLTADERSIFQEDMAEAVADKIVEKRAVVRTRFWDQRAARFALYVGAGSTTLTMIGTVVILVRVATGHG
jgi:hypothetical protein